MISLIRPVRHVWREHQDFQLFQVIAKTLDFDGGPESNHATHCRSEICSRG